MGYWAGLRWNKYKPDMTTGLIGHKSLLKLAFLPLKERAQLYVYMGYPLSSTSLDMLVKYPVTMSLPAQDNPRTWSACAGRTALSALIAPAGQRLTAPAARISCARTAGDKAP